MQGRGQQVELHLGILHLWSWVLAFFCLFIVEQNKQHNFITGFG